MGRPLLAGKQQTRLKGSIDILVIRHFRRQKKFNNNIATNLLDHEFFDMLMNWLKFPYSNLTINPLIRTNNNKIKLCEKRLEIQKPLREYFRTTNNLSSSSLYVVKYGFLLSRTIKKSPKYSFVCKVFLLSWWKFLLLSTKIYKNRTRFYLSVNLWDMIVIDISHFVYIYSGDRPS